MANGFGQKDVCRFIVEFGRDVNAPFFCAVFAHRKRIWNEILSKDRQAG
jgi:hypothetical protein